MTVIMSERGCQGGGCNQGRAPESCDCWLSNRQLAEQVNDEAWHHFADRFIEWACAIGVITLVYLILFKGF